MKTHFIFLFVILTIFSCGPKKVEIKYPSGAIKEVYSLNKNGEKEGKYQAYSEAGKLTEEATFKNGAFIGQRILYFENGNPEIEENYLEKGILDGSYKVFYNDGQIHIEKKYVNNVLSGVVKAYYPSGKVKEEVTMSDNNENGPFTEYYENGKVHWKGTYLNGDNEFGLLEEWDSLGAPIKRMKCDSLAICRTFWKPGMPEVNYDTLKQLPTLNF